MSSNRLATLALAAATLCNTALAADANDGLFPTGMPGAGGFDVQGTLSGTRVNRDGTFQPPGLNFTDKSHQNELNLSGRYGLSAQWALLLGMQASTVNVTRHAANGVSQHVHTEGLSGTVVGVTRDLLPRDGRPEALTADLTVRRNPQRRNSEVTMQYGLNLTGSYLLSDEVHPYVGLNLSAPNESTGKRQSAVKVGAWFRQDEDVTLRANLIWQRDHGNDLEQGNTLHVLEVGSIVTLDTRTRVLPTLSIARLLPSGTRNGNLVITGGHGMTLALALYHAY